MSAHDTRSNQPPAWISASKTAIRRLPRGRYPVMNWICKRNAARFDAPLGVTCDRMHFVCDLADGIAREAYFMGHYEPQETTLLCDILRPDMSFVDVGANWGYHTLLAADLVGLGGRVVALEPHPDLFALLEENVAKNRLSTVTPLCVAASDRDGDVNLAGFEQVANTGTSRVTEKPRPGVTNYSVKARILEPLLDAQGVGDVDLLKIDIEGGEGLVVPTIHRGLARGRFKYILLELHPRALQEMNICAQALIGTILKFGYRGWRIDHSSATSRRAAYKLPRTGRELLTPVAEYDSLDAWPHVLFIAPGVREL